jgi:predicted RNA-binding Zn ribbon-like protein
MGDVVYEGAAGRTFDLSGGALCLDFANTLDDRPDPHPNEWLGSYADLLAFMGQSRALPEHQVARLTAEAAHAPEAAGAVLARAIEVREAIYRLFLALADGEPVPASDLAALNGALRETLAHARLVPTEPVPASASDEPAPGLLAWGWTDDPLSLDAPLWPLVRSAADLLTSPTLSALRVCAADACAWLFLDTSRNGSRRWCSMRTCGNRAKARRHHARVRAASSKPTSNRSNLSFNSVHSDGQEVRRDCR